MTDATVLADALVEAEILLVQANQYAIKGRLERDHCYPAGDAEYVITDWRVAGKVLESMVSFDVDATDEWTISVWLSGAFTGPSATAGNESLPRAIIEAWYEAQNND